MTHSRTSRTLAATSVTAALLCGLPGVTDTIAAGSCPGVRNGQNYIDWARARSGQSSTASPNRRAQPLRLLLSTGAANGK
jgi:hypothetical protein